MPQLTIDQKADILQAIGKLTVHRRSASNWYATVDGIEVKQGSFLCGDYGNGKTPEAAIDDCFRVLTELKRGEYLVKNAYGESRRAMRWNGFMWQEVVEEKSHAS